MSRDVVKVVGWIIICLIGIEHFTWDLLLKAITKCKPYCESELVKTSAVALIVETTHTFKNKIPIYKYNLFLDFKMQFDNS